MNLLHITPKTITPRSDSLRHISLTLAKNRKNQNSCQETDCCGNPINVQPKPTVYIERSCQPCCFFTWRPKIPILQSAPPLVSGKTKALKKRHCYAGMKDREKSLEERKKEAAVCHLKCAAKPVCPPPPPPIEVKKKPVCEIPIPLPDWDCDIGQKKYDKCDDLYPKKTTIKL